MNFGFEANTDAITNSKLITEKDKDLCVELIKHCNSQGYCYLNDEEISEIMCVTAKTIKKRLKKLEDLAYLAIELEPQTSARRIHMSLFSKYFPHPVDLVNLDLKEHIESLKQSHFVGSMLSLHQETKEKYTITVYGRGLGIKNYKLSRNQLLKFKHMLDEETNDYDIDF